MQTSMTKEKQTLQQLEHIELDVDWYIKEYPDVLLSGLPPEEHFLRYGRLLGRSAAPRATKSSVLQRQNLFDDSGESEKLLTTDSAGGSAHLEIANIRGGLNLPKTNESIIRGWLAKIGSEAPRTGVLLIDADRRIEFLCNAYRTDLKKNKINSGHHAFEIVVPFELIDGKEHTLQLFDKHSGIEICKAKKIWKHTRTFTDFDGFLANSLISPLLPAPFREEDKRCFAVMENIANHLNSLALSREEPFLVSVVMPVHNRHNTLRNAVDSVLEQSYSNLELIIVDDGSTDGSYELAHQLTDPRVRVLRNADCAGVSVARNKGLEAARGSHIAYLDSDNTWDPRYIGATIGAFLSVPDAQAIYSGQLLYRGNHPSPFAVRFGSFNKQLLSNRNYIDLNALCHTRQTMQKVGGFDENLKRYVDWDLVLRISEKVKAYSVPVLLSHYFYDRAENTITNNAQHASHIDRVKANHQLRLSAKKHDYEENTKTFYTPLKTFVPISVIIPSYESLEDLQECVQSVLNTTDPETVEVIVVDNASSENVASYLNRIKELPNVKVILNEINYGFTYAVNQGIKASRAGRDIVLLNNDAVVTEGALQALSFSAYKYDKCGLVVPQQVLPPHTKTIVEHVPYANPDSECDVNLSSHHANIARVPIFHDGGAVEITFAPFFCTYIRRDVYARTLGLDAEFGRHYRSDRIFCSYVRHILGLRIYHEPQAVVIHKLQKSTETLRTDSDKLSEFMDIFHKNKWPESLASQLGFRTAAWDT